MIREACGKQHLNMRTSGARSCFADYITGKIINKTIQSLITLSVIRLHSQSSFSIFYSTDCWSKKAIVAFLALFEL